MRPFFVTGATGFLGGRLVEILLEQGHSVVAVGRNKKALENLKVLGAETHACDLATELELLKEIIPHGSIVVHCAALSSAWGKESDFYEANVTSTENVAEAALHRGVSRFVHISTPSVYVTTHDQHNISETDPLDHAMINTYAKTKLLAEKKLLVQVYKNQLPVIILRPQGIIGPKDPSILPRIIRVARKGKLPVFGNGKNKIDLTYVDNVVEAILCAARALTEHHGKIYNITNGEPVENYTILRSVLGSLGIPVQEKRIPIGIAIRMGSMLETIYRMLSLKGEPILTRYSVCALGLTRTLDITNAKRDLNYSPKISLQEGIQRYIQWYQTSES
ncbi:MAG: NAD-dependent epimerase/dehydratase family protein [Xanthomonadaceae bacterium]|nr:NAD-dependent epimerase/dehydratase family protein [Xanthomonadaceae bacterium]